MEGDSEACCVQSLSSHHSCLLVPASKELQAVGSWGKPGCLRNNGHGREGRGVPAGPVALLPEAFQGPGAEERLCVVIGGEGYSTLHGGESEQRGVLLSI